MRIFVFISISIFLIPAFSSAQLCSGSKGDPIVNVTFGTSSDPLPPGTTSLSYVGSCPYDTGSYTINTFLFGCGETRSAKSWHSLIGDHTRDATGQMNSKGQYMLVNASWIQGISHPPVVIHSDTAFGLCGNTTYEYSAWLANVMRDYACGSNPKLPNINFTVSSLSGVTLASTNTGALPIEDERVWKQYGLTFTTPLDADAVVLTLSLMPEQGCGNAFVLDDITFKMCGPAVTATLDGKTDPVKVCADYTDPFILQGNYGEGFNDPAVQWQSSLDSGVTWTDIPGQTSLTYAIPRRSIGNVVYRLAAAEKQNIGSPHCRIVSNAIYTEVHPVPPHNAPQNLIGCISKDLHLPAADPFSLNVLWAGPNGYSSTESAAVVRNVQLNDTGIYKFKQFFSYGCTTLDTFYLKVFPSTTVSTQTLYNICEGNNIHLSASGAGTFKWTPSVGLSNDAVPDPVASPHDSTIYKVVVTNSFGCKDSADITVNVFRNPFADAGPDRTIVIGDTVTLKASVKGTAIDYAWTPPVNINDPHLVTPNVYPIDNTEYTLTAVSRVGCGTATSNALVKVYRDIFIPSAFTPNGDGKNDVFKVFAADGYKLNKFIIYNRWGKVVFTAKETSDGWNGNTNNQQQPADTYVYYLEIKSAQGKVITKKGTITLLR